MCCWWPFLHLEGLFFKAKTEATLACLAGNRRGGEEKQKSRKLISFCLLLSSTTLVHGNLYKLFTTSRSYLNSFLPKYGKRVLLHLLIFSIFRRLANRTLNGGVFRSPTCHVRWELSDQATKGVRGPAWGEKLGCRKLHLVGFDGSLKWNQTTKIERKNLTTFQSPELFVSKLLYSIPLFNGHLY